MVWFIFCSAMTWALMTCLLIIEPNLSEIFSEINKTEERINLLIRWLFSAIVPSLVIAIIIALAYAPFSVPSSEIYQWYDFFNDLWFAQCLLGGIFGAVLAIWLRRAYFLPAGKDMSLPMKIEGIVLVLLFFVGTSSTPLADLLRGASIESGFLNLKLSDAATGPTESKEQPNNISPRLAGKLPAETGCRDKCQDEELGLTMAVQLPLYMAADAIRMERKLPPATQNGTKEDAQNALGEMAAKLRVASEKYQGKIGIFASCLRALTTVTDDREYARSLLIQLKPAVADLYFLSLRKMTEPGADQLIDDEVAKSADELADRLNSLSTDAEKRAKRIANIDDESTRSACDVAPDPYTGDELIEVIDQKRPYLSILYASILQLEHQEVDAVEALEKWLDAYDRAIHTEGDKALPGSDIIRSWLRLRVISTQYGLYESLFRRDPEQSVVTLKNHLDKTSQLIDALKALPSVQLHYKDIFENPSIQLIESNFESEAAYRDTCPEDAQPDDIQLSNVLVLAKAVYAWRAIDHPKFSESYFPSATLYAEQIANADYGCLRTKLGIASSEAERAENLLVFALFTRAVILAHKPIGSAYNGWLVTELHKMLGALKMARSIAETYRKDVRPGLEDELELLIQNAQNELNHGEIAANGIGR